MNPTTSISPKRAWLAWPRLPFPAVFICLLWLVACASPRVVQPPDVYDDHGMHVVGHAPGHCSICDLYGRTQQLVVAIEAGGLGAGVVVAEDGIVVTNAHVVDGASEAQVATHDGARFPARKILSDAALDLAILSVDAPGRVWAVASMDAGSSPPVGSEVFIIGHPLGLGWTVTRGIVSGIRRDQDGTMIQTDAATSPGNSGGAMLDADGNLIGVVTSKLVGEGAENLAFARSAESVLDLLAALGRQRSSRAHAPP